MDCQNVYKLMNRYIDGEITQEEERVLEFHLERCRDCQIEFGQLKELDILLNSLEPSRNFTTTVIQQIQEKKRSKFKRWLPKTKKGWLGVAAVILLCFYLFPPWFMRTSEPGLIISSGEIVSGTTENGEHELRVENGEIWIKDLEGTLTAINSQIFLENPEAEVKENIFAKIKQGIINLYNKIKSYFIR